MITRLKVFPNFIVHHALSGVSTPLMPLIPQFEMELIEAGFNQQNFIMSSWNPVLWAETFDGKALGFLFYTEDLQDRHMHIRGAYVLPSHRNRECDWKVYDRLFLCLTQLASHKHIGRILSGTHINNIAAQKAFERQGRQKIGLTYEFLVPLDPPRSFYDKD